DAGIAWTLRYLTRIVVGTNREQHADRPVGQCLQSRLSKRQVVLELGADWYEHPGIPRLIEIRWRLAGRLPDTKRSDVVMAWREPVEGEVEDLVGGVQHQIRAFQQRRVAREQRDRARADVLLDRTGWIRTDVKGAIDHRPGAGW